MPASARNEGSHESISKEEYEGLMQRMALMRLRDAEMEANIDAKDGLETIDLGKENTTGPNPTASDLSMPITEVDPPDALFRKTKSNNFFAVDDSLDRIEPLDGASQDEGEFERPPARKPVK